MAIYRARRRLYTENLPMVINNQSSLPSVINQPKPNLPSVITSPAPTPNITMPTTTPPVSTSKPIELVEKGSVGIKQGALNTWNRMGKMGKAGVIGAGIIGTGLMAKGLFGGSGNKNPKENAFSDDTKGSLREAGLIGGGLALTTGGVLLAKHGGLGLTKAQRVGNKEAYNKVVRKVKSVWAETKKESGKKPKIKVTTRETVETPKKEVKRETIKETGRKPESKEVTVVKGPRKRYSDEDFKRIRESLMKKGIKHPKAPDIEKEASVLGIK